MFKKTLVTFLLVMLSTAGQAALFDRGGGMIYDDALDITWLQDANQGGLMNWDDSVAWAAGLEYGGFDDWRLPSIDVNGDDTIVYCNVASEMACRDNELGYMFYQNLMGSLFDNLTGDQGLFTNLQPLHWSGTEYWTFSFSSGTQDVDVGFYDYPGAWAVRAGDVGVVPLPAGFWLLGSALLGFVVMQRR